MNMGFLAPHASNLLTPEGSVLIKTLPLTSGNYGGILQAYALQSTVRELGYQPTLDTPTRIKVTWKTYPRYLRDAIRNKGFDSVITGKLKNTQRRKTQAFIETHFRTVDLFGGFWEPKPSKSQWAPFNIFLAGSDQVWRPEYAHVPSYMFDFVKDKSKKLCAYSASFGRSDLSEFPPKHLTAAKDLLSRFYGISVREQNGVQLARDLNAKAQWVLDPVLLAGRSVFDRLLVDRPLVQRPQIAVLMLDSSPSREKLIQDLAARTGLDVIRFYPEQLKSRRAFKDSPERYTFPSVESWLDVIRSSSFVLTDSYHVTLFSLLFEREFLTIGNAARGLERFTSILDAVNLPSRLIDEATEITPALEPIGWNPVHRRLNSLRSHSLAFLEDALACGTR
jgi:hypothetical protein